MIDGNNAKPSYFSIFIVWADSECIPRLSFWS